VRGAGPGGTYAIPEARRLEFRTPAAGGREDTELRLPGGALRHRGPRQRGQGRPEGGPLPGQPRRPEHRPGPGTRARRRALETLDDHRVHGARGPRALPPVQRAPRRYPAAQLHPQLHQVRVSLAENGPRGENGDCSLGHP
jgi:hypothetical protein